MKLHGLLREELSTSSSAMTYVMFSSCIKKALNSAKGKAKKCYTGAGVRNCSDEVVVVLYLLRHSTKMSLRSRSTAHISCCTSHPAGHVIIKLRTLLIHSARNHFTDHGCKKV